MQASMEEGQSGETSENLYVKMRKSSKVYTGWWIVLAGGILSLWGAGFSLVGFSALFKPIAAELGFSRAVTSVAAGISRLEGGFEGPLAGWATDKFGARWIVISGTFLMGIGLVLMNFVNSLWAFYVVWGVILSTGSNIALHLPLDTAISNWFVKKRGLALGIKQALTALAGVLVLPLLAWLIVTQGWRTACVIGGLGIFLVCLPLIWCFLKQHRPEYYGLLPDGATAREAVADINLMIEQGVKYAVEVKEVEFTLRQAMRTPAYWLLLVVFAFHGLVAPTISLHCIPFLTDIGIDPIRAATMMATISLAGIPSRLLSGFLCDRIRMSHLRFLIAGALLFEATGLILFLLNQTINMIYVWFILHGIGMGGCWTVMSPVRARYFGRKAFGSISGSSALFMTPIGVAAPVYAGWAYDTTGSYITVFILFAGLLVLSAILASLTVPPKPPTAVSDIHKIL